MAYNIPQTITELNLVLQGVGHLGVSKSFTLPEVKKVMYQQKVAAGTRQIDTGRFEAMTFDATVEEFSSIALSSLTTDQLTGNDAFIYGYFDFSDGSGTSNKGVLTMKGPVISVNDGSLESGNQVARKITIGVNYYTFTVNNEQVFMLDIENNILK